MDHLKFLAPERWDPLREALRSVGKTPSVCSFLGDGTDWEEDDEEAGGFPSVVGQAEVALALEVGQADRDVCGVTSEADSVSQHLKVESLCT